MTSKEAGGRSTRKELSGGGVGECGRLWSPVPGRLSLALVPRVLLTCCPGFRNRLQFPVPPATCCLPTPSIGWSELSGTAAAQEPLLNRCCLKRASQEFSQRRGPRLFGALSASLVGARPKAGSSCARSCPPWPRAQHGLPALLPFPGGILFIPP